MTIESCQCELSIVPGKVQYQIQTANTKQVTEKEELVREPLLEKLRFHVNTQDSKLINITKSFRSPEQSTQRPGVELYQKFWYSKKSFDTFQRKAMIIYDTLFYRYRKQPVYR